MPRVNNPVMGHITCSTCGQRATVHQTSRGKGRYLYSKGCECKARQSAGATFQAELWRGTEWLPGVEPIRPPNVPGELPDFEPGQAPASDGAAAAPPPSPSERPPVAAAPERPPTQPDTGHAGRPGAPAGRGRGLIAGAVALIAGVALAALGLRRG